MFASPVNHPVTFQKLTEKYENMLDFPVIHPVTLQMITGKCVNILEFPRNPLRTGAKDYGGKYNHVGQIMHDPRDKVIKVRSISGIENSDRDAIRV